MSLYRDPLATLRSQIGVKRALCGEREQELSPLLRAMAPPPHQARLKKLRDGLVLLDARYPGSFEESAGGSFEAFKAIDAALDALLAAYDELAALAPRLRPLPADVPDPPPPDIGPPYGIEEPSQLMFRRRLGERICSVLGTPSHELIRWGDFGYLARHRVQNAPINLLVSCAPSQPFQTLSLSFGAMLYSSVPASAPRLEVRPRRIYDRFVETFASVTLPPDLDHDFVVSGQEEAKGLVSGDVARAWSAFRGYGPHAPRLDVRDGVVSLSWTGESPEDLTAEVLFSTEALAVVLGVRAAFERA